MRKAFSFTAILLLVVIFVSTLVGCTGAQGIQGLQGAPGVKGDKGDKGDTGAQGIQGLQGAPGVKGGKGDPFIVVSRPDVGATDRFVDGIWRVGVDIKPGLYWTQTTGGYWARLMGFGGTISDIIANGSTAGPTYVRIAPTDAGFESSRCSSWIRVGD